MKCVLNKNTISYLGFFLSLIFCLLAAPSAKAASTYSPNTFSAVEPTGSSIVDQYPNLRPYLREEPKSKLKFGVGLSPILLYSNRMGVGFNLFQIHWTGNWLDWEVISTSVAISLAKEEKSTKSFVVRSSPKIRWGKILSLGPLVGMEFISFPNVLARISKGTIVAPEEPFSSYGAIYGGMMSETIPWTDRMDVRISQIVFKETYPVTSPTRADWGHRFSDPTIQADPEKKALKPGLVFLFEVSLLF